MNKLKTVLIIILVLQLIAGVMFPVSALSLAPDGKNIAVDNLVSTGSETFYRILVKNDDTKLHKYILSYEYLPKGYEANFMLEDKVINEVEINAGDSRIIAMKVIIPDAAEAGTNIISAVVKRDDGQVYTMPLSLTINHDYALSITNQLNNLNAINGQNLSFDIVVANIGSKDLNDIMLKLTLPYKWVLQSISPEKSSLKANESTVFKVTINVPPTQASGNSKIIAEAFSEDTISTKVEVPVSVQNNPNYLYWMIGMIVLAGISMILYFRRHGRR